MDDVRESNELRRAVAAAWRSFGAPASLEARVSPAIPILFFGDLDAYAGSQQRVLTVGLNPSLIEFPADDPYHRFPLAEGRSPRGSETVPRRPLGLLPYEALPQVVSEFRATAQWNEHQLLRPSDFNRAAHGHLLPGGHRSDLETTQQGRPARALR